MLYPFRTRQHELVAYLDDERLALAGLSKEPSDGLEPSTPSLPFRAARYGEGFQNSGFAWESGHSAGVNPGLETPQPKLATHLQISGFPGRDPNFGTPQGTEPPGVDRSGEIAASVAEAVPPSALSVLENLQFEYAMAFDDFTEDVLSAHLSGFSTTRGDQTGPNVGRSATTDALGRSVCCPVCCPMPRTRLHAKQRPAQKAGLCRALGDGS